MTNETEESKIIANKWNQFLIEAQKSPHAFVYILNYIVVLLDQCATQNNKPFVEMLGDLEKIYNKGMWQDFKRQGFLSLSREYNSRLTFKEMAKQKMKIKIELTEKHFKWLIFWLAFNSIILIAILLHILMWWMLPKVAICKVIGQPTIR